MATAKIVFDFLKMKGIIKDKRKTDEGDDTDISRGIITDERKTDEGDDTDISRGIIMIIKDERKTDEGDDTDRASRMEHHDNLSTTGTSGFNSESDSLFSSDGEEDCPDDSDNDPNFVPPTDTDSDTSSKHDDVQVTQVPESDESEESVTFSALSQKQDPVATLPAQSSQDGEPSITVQSQSAQDREPSITVQSTTDKKCWYCVFCGRAQKRLPRHLLTQHADEESVTEFASCRDEKQKCALLSKMRNLGNHLHNVEVLKNGKGVMIVSHRPTKCKDDQKESYVPCPYCYGYFLKVFLYRHACSFATVGDKVRGGRVRKGQCLLPNQTKSTRFSEFQSSFRKDVVSTLAKTDHLIAKYGEVEFDKNGHDPDMHNYIRTKVRTVAKVLLEVRKVVGSPVSLTDCISPDKYDALVEATKRLAGYNGDSQEFDTPSFAKNCGMYFKKCALIHQSVCLQNLDSVGEQKALQMIKLIELTWNQRISHHALRTLKKRKMNSPCLLPVTSDIVLLSSHLQEKAKRCADLLESDTLSADSDTVAENWKTLNSVTLTQIMMFNRRRQGEVSKMKVAHFTQHSETCSHDDEIERNVFSKLELKLSRCLTRIEIPGKKGRTVPILLTSAMKGSLKTLVFTRDKVGINPDNTFLFPRQGGGSLGHIRGSDCLRDEVAECGVKHPEIITSTKLRKQIATISQVVNLKDHELDVLADFMGHDIRIHREFYRLPQQTYQAAKVSKLLLALEKGNLATIRGKTLDEITVSAADILDEEGDEEEEEDVVCEETAPLSTIRQQPAEKTCKETVPLSLIHQQPAEKACKETAPLSTIRQHPAERSSNCARAVDGDSVSDKQPCSSSPTKTKRTADCGVVDDSDCDGQPCSSSHPKRRKTRANTARKSWTSEERNAVDQHFAKFFLNCKLPGKAEIEAAQEQSRVLANRKWKNIKDFIRNNLK